MSAPSQEKPQPVRLVFKLERAENPRLYDELVQFAQGVKRVNRLRVLAYDGLLAQHGVFSLSGATSTLTTDRSGATATPSAVTNQVFGPGLVE
ncbi:hypothetical protein [Paracidovorax anthurii]|uniref:Uncharacterized protein n=1 Tax=Paracidovorax anthurii TaxID=78229 RepID=A0A328Z4G4_9BURK|nr:hypothetical protein [Paracidovorax anthurii]RAR81030.1 hypothetical protein AX018_102146 [Paracidovorax anthurii]